jgi:hypothetical protein
MKHLLILIVMCISIATQAQQQLIFTNTDSSKKITVKPKDLVKLAFTGYFGQPQMAEGFVTNINDSTISLAPRKKLLAPKAMGQTIYIKDIIGFKRYSKFRQAGEIIYGIVGIGIAGTVTAIVGNANLPSAASFATAAGTSIIVGTIKSAVLPTKIKYKMSDGWQLHLMNTQNK